jgi:hypothetical protein
MFLDEEVVEAADAGLGYTQSALRSLQDRQTGRASSHLTLRTLQLRHPARDFL